jgi:hypothetical protein
MNWMAVSCSPSKTFRHALSRQPYGRKSCVFSDTAHISILVPILCRTVSRYSDWLRAGRPRDRSSSPGRVKNFLFSTSSRPALGSTQLPIQWVPGALSPGQSGRGLKLTTHLQLVRRSRKYGSTHPLPRTPSFN